MTVFPPFTDLGALADRQAARGNTKLRAAMTMAWRVQSCLGDLRQAMDCVAVLTGQLKSRPATSPGLVVERALMATAIMLYARATSTSGQKGERGSVQLDQSRLSESEWNDHCAIVEVRNRAMAHVYTSHALSEHEWHRDLFFAVQMQNGLWKPASASNQTSYHMPTLQRLERMLPVAHRELKAKFHKRMGAVTNMINREVAGDALSKNLFDPVATFGSVAAVQTVLAGEQDGEMAIWTSE